MCQPKVLGSHVQHGVDVKLDKLFASSQALCTISAGYTTAATLTPGKTVEAGDDLLLLLEEWELGIQMLTQRAKPLWELELAMKQNDGHKWRFGDRLRKQVQQRKVLIYKIFRTADHSRPDVRIPEEAARRACASITAGVRTETSKVKNRPASIILSLSQLFDKLNKDAHEEKPSDFERDTFGWPVLACQRAGNPRALAQQAREAAPALV